MIRSCLVLFLTLLCACLPRTTQSPTAGTDDAPRDEKRSVTQADETPPPDAPPSTWGRYAAPPPGTPPIAQNERTREPTATPPAPRREPPRDDRYAEPEARYAPAEDKGALGDAQKAPASAPARSESGRASSGAGSALAERSRKDRSNERPGLGTSWGETRSSQVDEVAFYRDSSTPNYTASLNYNDANGAYALAGNPGYSSVARVGIGSALTMTVRDEYGNDLNAYRGNGRTVAVGQNGQRYVIVVHNTTNERFEVVLSVDGLDVLDGQEAAYGKRGYLIDPYGTLEIEGFRQSSDAVAAFRFGNVSDSYAARTGAARNVGVIGAAAFGERGYAARLSAYRDRVASWRSYNTDTSTRRDADPFPGRYATPPSSYNIAR